MGKEVREQGVVRENELAGNEMVIMTISALSQEERES